jgi:hypothetical protein
MSAPPRGLTPLGKSLSCAGSWKDNRNQVAKYRRCWLECLDASVPVLTLNDSTISHFWAPVPLSRPASLWLSGPQDPSVSLGS